jgi:hypothetical protein
MQLKGFLFAREREREREREFLRTMTFKKGTVCRKMVDACIQATIETNICTVV